MTTNVRNVGQTMDQMYLERDQMGDVTFLVDSQRIRAHRIVLATQSPKYKAQFFGPNPDGAEIHVPFVTATAFNVFLQFFYKKTIDLTMDNIETVLDLAKQSLVDDFIETCVNFLKRSVNANKFSVAYRLANLYDLESLRLDCEQRISTNTMDVFASDDFLRCDRDMLLQILQMDTLNCSEKDVFAACIARARIQCKRINLDGGRPENLRIALGDAIYQIRFSSFSAEEFAALHKSMEGFFTTDESIELLYIIGKLKDFKSEKFNPKPRMLQTEPEECPNAPAAWSLEIDRFSQKRNFSMEKNVSGIFKFSFSCSVPIRLHGIGVCIHFNEAELKKFPKTLSVRATCDDAFDFTEVQFAAMKCKVYKNLTRGNETMVIFEKPMERVIQFECSMQIPSKRLNYEFDFSQTIRANDMVFTFRDGKWMKRLFFDKYHA